MTTNRLHEFDIMKGIGIVLVVLGHSLFVSESLVTYLFSFHMPLFFVISGMQMGSKSPAQTPFRSFLKKRACRILIPYACFSILYIGVDLIYHFTHPELMSAADIRTAVLQGSSFFGISVLWFLPTLFLGELVMHRFCALLEGKREKISMLLALGIAVFSALLGVLIQILSRSMEQEAVLGDSALYSYGYYFLLGIGRCFIAIAFLILGRTAFFLLRKHMPIWLEIILGLAGLVGGFFLSLLNQRVDMHHLILRNPIFFIFSALLSSLGLYMIARNLPRLRLVEYLGRNSLIVMVTHLDLQIMATSIWVADVANRHLPFTSDFMFHVYQYGYLLVAEILLIIVGNRFLFFLFGSRKPIASKI